MRNSRLAPVVGADWKKGILQLKEIVDVISISLNGTTPQEHNKLNHPMFAEESFKEIVKFEKLEKEKNSKKDILENQLGKIDYLEEKRLVRLNKKEL